jgi:hypothetical protein
MDATWHAHMDHLDVDLPGEDCEDCRPLEAPARWPLDGTTSMECPDGCDCPRCADETPEAGACRRWIERTKTDRRKAERRAERTPEAAGRRFWDHKRRHVNPYTPVELAAVEQLVSDAADDDPGEVNEPRCPVCADPSDYCQGHGEIGDPAGFAILTAHDDGNHDDCHPYGCDEAPRHLARLHPEDIETDARVRWAEDFWDRQANR